MITTKHTTSTKSTKESGAQILEETANELKRRILQSDWNPSLVLLVCLVVFVIALAVFPSFAKFVGKKNGHSELCPINLPPRVPVKPRKKNPLYLRGWLPVAEATRTMPPVMGLSVLFARACCRTPQGLNFYSDYTTLFIGCGGKLLENIDGRIKTKRKLTRGKKFRFAILFRISAANFVRVAWRRCLSPWGVSKAKTW